MKGWLREGHHVLFISQILGTGEDHRDIKPVVLGYSRVFKLLFGMCNRSRHRDDEDEKFRISSKMGFPPYFQIKKRIHDFRPDVAILRERSLYNIVVYHICRKLRIPAILYNQSPVWEKRQTSSSLLRKIIRKLSPQYRMTVSLGKQGADMVRDPHTYYISFVMEPHVRPEDKVYFRDGIIHFLFVARFVEWKNHMLVLPVFCNLVRKGYPVHLTVVGQAASEAEEKFYAKIVRYLHDNDLEQSVTLVRNANRDRVFEEYEKADVFLLPSREPISVSQLEAMSCSLPVICSNLPGKATYVKDGINGYLVKVNDPADLEEKMERMISDRDKLREMGRKSLELVEKNASFQNYYENIINILKDMKEKR